MAKWGFETTSSGLQWAASFRALVDTFVYRSDVVEPGAGYRDPHHRSARSAFRLFDHVPRSEGVAAGSRIHHPKLQDHRARGEARRFGGWGWRSPAPALHKTAHAGGNRDLWELAVKISSITCSINHMATTSQESGGHWSFTPPVSGVTEKYPEKLWLRDWNQKIPQLRLWCRAQCLHQ